MLETAGLAIIIWNGTALKASQFDVGRKTSKHFRCNYFTIATTEQFLIKLPEKLTDIS